MFQNCSAFFRRPKVSCCLLFFPFFCVRILIRDSHYDASSPFDSDTMLCAPESVCFYVAVCGILSYRRDEALKRTREQKESELADKAKTLKDLDDQLRKVRVSRSTLIDLAHAVMDCLS